MANRKWSELSEAAQAEDTDNMVVQRGGGNWRFPLSKLRTFLEGFFPTDADFTSHTNAANPHGDSASTTALNAHINDLNNPHQVDAGDITGVAVLAASNTFTASPQEIKVSSGGAAFTLESQDSLIGPSMLIRARGASWVSGFRDSFIFAPTPVYTDGAFLLAPVDTTLIDGGGDVSFTNGFFALKFADGAAVIGTNASSPFAAQGGNGTLTVENGIWDGINRVYSAGNPPPAGGVTNPPTTPGDLWTHNGADTARLPVGPDGTTPIADSGEPTGIRWGTVSGVGEANTNSNAGAGQILVKAKVGVDTPIKTLTSQDSSVFMTPVGGPSGDELDLSVQGHVPDTRRVDSANSITGGGQLTSNLTLALVGDVASPGNLKLYGTDGAGVKGWYDQPSGTGGGGIGKGNPFIVGELMAVSSAAGDGEAVSSGLTAATINSHIGDSDIHADHSVISVNAGSGLTGGGTIAATRTLDVGAGDGITVAANDVAVDSTVQRLITGGTNNNLVSRDAGGVIQDSGLATTSVSGHIADLANPHSVTAAQVGAIPETMNADGDLLSYDGIQNTKIGVGLDGQVLVARPGGAIGSKLVWETAPGGGGSGVTKGTPFALGELTEVSDATGDGEIISTGLTAATINGHIGSSANPHSVTHAQTNPVADEHVAHSGVTITAGAGLTGGGTIAATRTLDVGAGDGITVNANDVAVDATVQRRITGGTNGNLVSRDVNGDVEDAGVAAASFAPAAHVGAGGAEHPDAIAAGASGFMTGADKTKLDGITAGAEPNDAATLLSDTAATVDAAVGYAGTPQSESGASLTPDPTSGQWVNYTGAGPLTINAMTETGVTTIKIPQGVSVSLNAAYVGDDGSTGTARGTQPAGSYGHLICANVNGDMIAAWM